MKISKFETKLDVIKNYFKQAKKSIFTFTEIVNILEDKRLEWNLPNTMSSNVRCKIKKLKGGYEL
jgi:hypothetical protein